jgi:hypothetical protein
MTEHERWEQAMSEYHGRERVRKFERVLIVLAAAGIVVGAVLAVLALLNGGPMP